MRRADRCRRRRSRRCSLSLGASQRRGILMRRDLIGRNAVWRQRDREAANQAFGVPIEFGLAAKLRLDARDHASRAKTPRRRLLHPGPPGFRPFDLGAERGRRSDLGLLRDINQSLFRV